MLSENSPTVQGMINSVRQTGVQQPQFPFPSPKDMLMQGAFYQTPMPNQLYPMPYTYETDPQSVTRYIDIPGAPKNPDLADVPTVKPGRVFPNPVTDGMAQYAQNLSMGAMAAPSPYVGAYNPYGNAMPWNGQYSIPQQQMMPITPQETYGVVDYYDGQPIHPHSNPAWYGSPNHPFYQQTKFTSQEYKNSMAQRFAQVFPGYNNPYMGYGFSQPLQNSALTYEEQDMANLAAYYGMSYEKFLKNSSDAYKMMSRVSNKYFEKSEEEIKKKSKLYDVKPTNTNGMKPDDDETLFYPFGAFDQFGRLSMHYMLEYCVNDQFKNLSSKMKVSLTKDGKTNVGKRKVNSLAFGELRDAMKIADMKKNMMITRMNQNFPFMYANAPERKVDNNTGNVFEILSDTIAVAKQAELEQKLAYQKSTRSAFLFNRDTFISDIKAIFEQNRKRKEDMKITAIGKAVAKREVSDEQIQEMLQFNEDRRAHSADMIGNLMVAKPGYDILGIPINESVTKIYMMNMETGEEEVWDPTTMKGDEVRARIAQQIKPSFNDITKDEELQRRLANFAAIEYADF